MNSRREYFRKWYALHPGYRDADNRKRAMSKAPKRALNREIPWRAGEGELDGWGLLR